MVSRKSPLMRPLAKNATRPSSSKPSSRSAARRGFHVAGDGVVGGRAFGDADQDPVARGGREPHLVFIALALVVAQAHDGVAAWSWWARARSSARPLSRTSTCGSRGPVERIWLSLSCSTSHQERYGESTLKVGDRARRAPACRTCRTCAARSPGACGRRRRASTPPCRSRRAPGRRRSAPCVRRARPRCRSSSSDARDELVVAVDQVDAAPAAQPPPCPASLNVDAVEVQRVRPRRRSA